jgi:predicted Zn-ribbon and HTH transcriptional regulator
LRNEVSLITEPARCLDCGFVFKKRTRFTTPGRCPVCRSEAIAPPAYGIHVEEGKEIEHSEA